MKNYITAAGAQKLKDELSRLLKQDRPELVKVVQWAASNGDRSENGDYVYGKRRLREIDRRIRFLTQHLESAVIVDPKTQDPSRVLFGASVTVEDESGQEKTFRIVGQDEINPSQGWISWVSPVGKALLSHRVGDVVQVHIPKESDGSVEFEIKRISYIS